MVERRTLNKLLSIMDNDQHPLHHTVDRQRSTFSHRLLQLRCRRDRYRKSFLPHAITLYNNNSYNSGHNCALWFLHTLLSAPYILSCTTVTLLIYTFVNTFCTFSYILYIFYILHIVFYIFFYCYSICLGCSSYFIVILLSPCNAAATPSIYLHIYLK